MASTRRKSKPERASVTSRLATLAPARRPATVLQPSSEASTAPRPAMT